MSVSVGGYNIQDIPHSGEPLSPDLEHRLWYQYYFIEARLAAQPPIEVPTVALEGWDDGVGSPTEDDEDRPRFTGPYRRELLPGIGHNLPQEAPEAFTRAVLELARSDPSPGR